MCTEQHPLVCLISSSSFILAPLWTYYHQTLPQSSVILRGSKKQMSMSFKHITWYANNVESFRFHRLQDISCDAALQHKGESRTPLSYTETPHQLWVEGMSCNDGVCSSLWNTALIFDYTLERPWLMVRPIESGKRLNHFQCLTILIDPWIILTILPEWQGETEIW